MPPLTDVRDISRIGYGFMASRALFAALDADVFGHLAHGAKSLDALAHDTGLAAGRLRPLLTACVALGLLARDGEGYANAPASATYLVRTSPAYFGDYFRFQVSRQIYPTLLHLDAALRGERVDFYSQLRDPREASAFTRAQHSGSLGPAHVVARLVDLTDARRLLDVAGGSGAFSIVLCERAPALRSTIIDFPSVATVGRELVRDSGLASRITFVEGDAREVDWPGDNDVVLMSYLLSAVAAASVHELLAKAAKALQPGGRLLIHDFMVDDDETGPPLAALWLLNAITIDADVAALTPAWLAAAARRAGFVDPRIEPVVPGTTRLLTARR
ncbi:MAG TPA: methyltransferase [Methylomirabilota bacterium]|nr:methyltransferase [Methylomirabilota bacterium]